MLRIHDLDGGIAGGTVFWCTTNLEIEGLIYDFWLGLRIDHIFVRKGLRIEFNNRDWIELGNLGLRLD